MYLLSDPGPLRAKTLVRPSSMIGERQYEQVILQGSLCLVVFSPLSYHTRSWWPLVKLMSSLWKMAAHWNGAPVRIVRNATHKEVW